MLNILSAELMKYKRGKLLLFFTAAFVIYICCIWAALPSPELVLEISYLELFFDACPYIILFHIMIIGLLSTTIFSNEYKNNTIRQLFTIPVSSQQFYLAKFFVLITFSVLLMLGFALGVTVIGFIRHATEMTVSNIGWVFVISLVDAITLCVALIPIMLVMIISKQSILLSVLSVFVYTMIVVLPSMGMIRIDNEIWAYIIPLVSMGSIHNALAYIAFFPILPLKMPSANVMLCVVCLFLYAIIFSVLSIVVLKRQEH
ncbi:MAG: ABC transporter permease [Lachnospiraceae bacterium]